MSKLHFDGRRWVPQEYEEPLYQRQERVIERREGDHLIAGVLIGFAGGGVLTCFVLALGEILASA